RRRMQEDMGAVEEAAFPHGEAVRQFAAKPVVLETTDHAFCSATLAGLPTAQALGGTEHDTTAPGATEAPVPMRTPFRMMAPVPIQTSSSMTTARVTSGGRRERSPAGDEAMASRWRASSSMGWKSQSAMVTLYETVQRAPMRIDSAHMKTAPIRTESLPIITTPSGSTLNV